MLIYRDARFLLQIFIGYLISLLLASHHHLTELVKVHGPGAVLVQFLDDAVELLVSEGGEQLPNERPQGVIGDEALALLVVDPE